MLLKDLVPLFRFIGTFVVPILYIAAFATNDWVANDWQKYGLWNRCITNATRTSKKDGNSTFEECNGIAPGESPAYFEAVRTISCFTLLAYILYFWTFNEKESLGVGRKPAGVAALAATMGGLTFGIFVGFYEDDERWKGSGARLSSCTWVVLASVVLSVLMALNHLQYHRMKNQRSTTATSTVAPQTPRPAAAAATTGATRRSSDPTSAWPSAPGARSLPAISANVSQAKTRPATNSASRSTSDPPRGGAGGARARASAPAAELPVLRLPGYDVPHDMPQLPNSPPPSYEDAIGGGGGCDTPPPVYLP